jgi:hypothetical protein
MRQTFDSCCARAASGHAAIALPSSVMNWRRLTLMGFLSLRLATPQPVRSVLYDGKVDVNRG